MQFVSMPPRASHGDILFLNFKARKHPLPLFGIGIVILQCIATSATQTKILIL